MTLRSHWNSRWNILLALPSTFTSCLSAAIFKNRLIVYLIFNVIFWQILRHLTRGRWKWILKGRGTGPPVLTDLGVTVLPGLGGGHLHNLARSSFQHHKAIFAQGWALHGVGGGGPGIARLEVKVCICHHCWGGQVRTRSLVTSKTAIYNCSAHRFMTGIVRRNWQKRYNWNGTTV